MSKQDAQKAKSSYHSSENAASQVNTGSSPRRESNMSTSQNLTVNWTNVPTRTITAGGVEFAYRVLGTNESRHAGGIPHPPGCRPGQLGPSRG